MRTPRVLHCALILTSALLVQSCKTPTGTDAGNSSQADSGSAQRDAGNVQTNPDAGGGTTCAMEAGTKTVTTSDNVALVGDFYKPAGAVVGGVVLLHMIPPSNDRTGYPVAFINKLTDGGLVVFNIDRRGAGDSAGVATEAYEGDKGVLDAEAAVAFLQDSGCVTAAQVSLVGASNGTTTVLDYIAKSATPPHAAAWLTPGTYTENQNNVEASRAKLSMPLLFMWSAQETPAANWIAPFQTNAESSWSFDEYQNGGHGTNNFQAAPTSIDRVSSWLTGTYSLGG